MLRKVAGRVSVDAEREADPRKIQENRVSRHRLLRGGLTFTGLIDFSTKTACAAAISCIVMQFTGIY
jgi:hypothetical protein